MDNMNFSYFDIHSHIQFPQFDADRDQVIARMREKNIGTITVGTDREMSRKAVELAEKHENIWAAIGQHPNDNQTEEFDKKFYLELAKYPKVVAIGECGLDYFRVESRKSSVVSRQKDLFKRHVELAIETNKPLMIHSRSASEELLAIFDSELGTGNTQLRGNIHFFSDAWDIAQEFLKRGFTLSVGGPVTFPIKASDPRGGILAEVVRKIPLDKLMSETDSPDVAPVPYRGKRNEPVYVEEIVRKVAEIRNEDIDVVREQIVKNAFSCFNLNV